MSDISLFDSNFKVNTKLDADDIRFYNIEQPAFSVHRIFYESGKHIRMPLKSVIKMFI